ncbi:MAG TPA: hypothetical protein ENK66_08910, partial [Arcobacter sp.]|nr:hypothetical protein [Arcobacter sp.]
MKKLRLVIIVSFIIIFNGCGGENLTGVADKVLVPPTAIAGEDVHIRTDANVTLSAKESFDQDGSLIAYSWEENGTILSTGIELKNYSSKIVGKHTITLRVLDNDELNASDTVDIFVTLENQRPTAEAGDDKKIKVGDRVTLDGSGSSDVDGKIVFYEWRVKDSTEVLSTGVQLKDYAPKTEAIHILELTVTDNEGLFHKDLVYISAINNKNPIANAGNDQSIRTGENITLNGTKSSDSDGNITSYEWKENGVVLSTGVNLENYETTIIGEHN